MKFVTASLSWHTRFQAQLDMTSTSGELFKFLAIGSHDDPGYTHSRGQCHFSLLGGSEKVGFILTQFQS